MHKTQYQQCHTHAGQHGTAPFALFSHTTEHSHSKNNRPGTAPAPARRIQLPAASPVLPAITGSTERQIQCQHGSGYGTFYGIRSLPETDRLHHHGKAEQNVQFPPLISCPRNASQNTGCASTAISHRRFTAACRICRPARLQPAISAKSGNAHRPVRLSQESPHEMLWQCGRRPSPEMPRF